MTNELKEILRKVLKEELEPINNCLYVIEKDVKVIERSVKNIEIDVNDLKSEQVRLQKNIIESLANYNEKIVAHIDAKTEALNKRVYVTETEIQRLIKQ